MERRTDKDLNTSRVSFFLAGPLFLGHIRSSGEFIGQICQITQILDQVLISVPTLNLSLTIIMLLIRKNQQRNMGVKGQCYFFATSSLEAGT